MGLPLLPDILHGQICSGRLPGHIQLLHIPRNVPLLRTPDDEAQMDSLLQAMHPEPQPGIRL